MVDSPFVRPGVLGSAAPQRGRLARVRSNLGRTWSWSLGLTGRLTTVRQGLRAHLALAALALTVTSSLSLALFVPSAAADTLTDRRAQVTQALGRTSADLHESSQALSAAAAALAQAQGSLDAARAQLAQTRTELAAAQAADLAMAAKLVKARAALTRAKAAVVAGQRALDAKLALAGDMVRAEYQQQTNLMPIAILMENMSSADLQQRLQWSTTMFDTTGRAIDELKALQARLEARKARQAALEDQVAAARAEAAETLATKRSLEARAAAEEAGVSALVQQRAAVEAAAADDVAADRARYAQLTKERASVEQRIAARIAKAKAQEAARQAAARKAAAQRSRQAAARRAADRAAAEAERANDKARSARAEADSSERSAGSGSGGSGSAGSGSAGSGSGGSSSGGTNASGGFSYPVSAPVTSPYGSRFHPILRVWKLHDGTDFGAGCGTAIRAPYAGRVAERYYNAGYGNRLMIDHGSVGGRYVTTGYNHATHYTVSVGQRVSKGQVIGYVGTTGLSTGCHLHLMVWADGGLTNPMTWF